MIFKSENLSFELLDVLYIRQQKVSIFNTGRNFDALSFRLSASTRIEANTQTIALHGGDVCFVPARMDYVRTAETDEMIVIHLNVLGAFEKKMATFTPEHPEEMEARFRQILAVWEEKQPGYHYTATSLLADIFKECYLQSKGDTPVLNPRIAPSVAYMKEHLGDPDLTVRDIAAASCVSEAYFRRLFRAAYGDAPQAHIIRLRIGRAVALMSGGYYAIKEVAALCGYRDYKYFSTEFKRIKGVSPSEYLYNYKES